MSAIELIPPPEEPPSLGPDRTPPQDNAAEQSVLGAMMLSKDAIADVVEVVREQDFYRPAHQVIYGVLLDLYGKGEPADAVTVSAELQRIGELSRIGGAPYLHTLVSMVPTAANAGYYGRIVREKAILRRLVEAGTRIVQMGYQGQGEVDDVVDRAQAEVYEVTDRRTSEDYAPLRDIMDGALTEIEAIANRSGEMVGVPTGFTDLDQLTNGLHPGQLIIIAARPAVGKALALDTPIPTPTGWTTQGDVRPGDLVLGDDGRPVRVSAVSEVWSDRPCYRVEFSDGSAIVADAEHEWLTHDRSSRRRNSSSAAIRTTRELAVTLRCDTADERLNHSITNALPLDLPHAELDVAPYTLGVWLGDGTSAAAHFTSADPEIAMYVEADGYAAPCIGHQRYEITLLDDQPFCNALGKIGVLGDKHIPTNYLRSSIDQRRALLAGLLDTDGTVTANGSTQFTTTSPRLASDVRELITSLGYRVSVSHKKVAGRSEASSTAYTLTFTTHDEVFRLERKLLLAKERLAGKTSARHGMRFITHVIPVASVPVRCIEVENESHLYLAGASMVPTHNSTLGVDIARAASIKHNLASVIFSLEMSRNEIVMRLLSAEAQVPLHHMRAGTMSDADWKKLASKMGTVSEAPLFIDDSPNMTLMEIRAKCRRLKQRHDLRLVIVDYLQLMTSGKKVESRQQEVSEFSRSLKLLAKELEVPVIAISQLNRGPEQRTDKKPMMSDLRESGCLPASTRIIRADTGVEVTMGELFESGERDVPVWSLDDSLRYVTRPLTHVFSTGRKEVFRLRTASGRTLEATANHPLLTYAGWQPLGSLETGARIGIPRHVPAPEQETVWEDDKVIVLAHMLNELKDFALHEKFVPADVYSLPKRQIALFLSHLWATDGSITITPNRRGGRVYYATTSRRLADDVARLLLRFGINARITVARKAGYRDGYHVIVSGGADQKVFLRRINSHGARGVIGRELLALLENVPENTNRDTVPSDVWGKVRAVISEKGMTHREFQAQLGTHYCGSSLWKAAPSRERLRSVAAVLDSEELDLLATNDVYWDEIVHIESLGDMDVYDAEVLGTHNFIADGVVVHNSLEQDADMVILLHREDAYEKESPRAGEADFIVAKHRNGPTSTVTVAFQGHYSRFVDMAQI